MKTVIKKLFLGISLVFLLIINLIAQEPTSTPPEEDTIKIFTEEVKLNVTAQYSNGRFASTLKPDDLLIVESGDPQEITSMKKVPASVLVLLDTGGNLNYVKTLGKTRLVAKLLVEKLSSDNKIAVLQSYNKVEVVSDWTSDKAIVQNALNKKLFAGNSSRFSDSIKEAIRMFKMRSLENRHLVFIGDGLDSVASETERQEALRNLIAANITIHVIAYNKMETSQTKPMTRPFQIGERIETKRLPEHIIEQIIENLPVGMRDNFRRMVQSERLFILRLDRKRRKINKKKHIEWQQSEIELKNLAEDTGGIFQSPEQLDTMFLLAIDIAKAVDSNYVITYTPTKPIAETENGKPRKVRVSSHCNGVKIKSRQKIIANAQ